MPIGVSHKTGGMMRCCLALLVAWLVACNPLYAAQPVGEKPRNLVAEKEAWEGTWVHGEGAITVAVTDAEQGRMQIAWFEKKQAALVPSVYDVELRTFDKSTFASVKDRESGRYVFARVETKDRQIVVYVPKVAAWMRVLRDKQVPNTLKPALPGGRSESEATLGPLSSKDLAFITASERAYLFLADPPTAFIKVTK